MSQICNHCGMPIRPGFKFCNVCGSPIQNDTIQQEGVKPYSELMGYQGQTIRILTGEDAGDFVDVWPTCVIGREDADLIIEDKTLSAKHARINVNEKEIVIEDLDSLNGVFLKSEDKHLLSDNDIIRAGDHFFLYELFSQEKIEGNYGATFYASPSRGERFRLIEILSGGKRGRACAAPDGGIAVGRTDGDFTFPDDERMSSKHFSIRWTQRGGILRDYSENGTYIQIHKPVKLSHGDLFFAGKTLFKVI